MEKGAQLVTDYVSVITGGMDSGQLPRLLAPGKVAFGFNCTFRGGFPIDRPKYRKLALTFESADVQEAFETGLFQGAGYFRFQSGKGAIIASVSGRLFQLVPDTASGASVTERTIPGDPNLATQPKVWIWQGELWENISDGNDLPIFMDDTTARRSFGPSLNIGTTAANFTVPEIGDNVTVVLASNYTGPLNAVVVAGPGAHLGAKYIVIAIGAPGAGSGYEASIKNINDTPGTALAVGTPVIVPGTTNVIGTTAAPFNVPQFTNVNVTVQFTTAVSFPGSSPVWMAGRRFTFSNIEDLALHKYRLKTLDPATGVTIPAGTQCTYPQSAPITQPSYTIGNIVVAATAPAVNASTSVFLDTLYTGNPDMAVTINNKNYRISPVAQAPPVPSTTIVLQNLTDNAGTTVNSGTLFSTVGELGIGRMGVYGQGRNWMSLIDGVSFTASDLVGESSGSSAFSYRDAVLKVSKNEALTAGKPFRIPSSGDTIQGMSFPAQLDASLGQGPLSVFGGTNVFSCLAPTDSTTWAALTTPILPETLIGSGTTSHWSIVRANGDLFFRSPDGIRSQLIARLDFDKWNNTAISYEITRVINQDDTNLLNYCSATAFNNRLLMTSNPIQGPRGIYHRGLMVINFDTISALQGKAAPSYDGLWTGLQILQLIQSPLNGYAGETRQFALCYNSVEGIIELWEILPDGEEFEDRISDEPVCVGGEPELVTSPAPDNLTLWLSGDAWADALWRDRTAAIPFTSNGLGLASFTPPNLVNLGNLPGGVRQYSGTVTNTPVIFLQYSVLSLLSAGVLLSIGGAAVFKIEFVTAGGTIRVTTGGVNTLDVSGITSRPQEYIIQVSTDPVGGTILTVYNASTLAVVGTNSMAAGVDLTGANAVVVSSASNGIFFAMFTRGLLAYSSVPTGEDLTRTLQYLSDLLLGRSNTPEVCAPATVRTIWGFESPDLFRGEKGELITTFKALEGGEVSVDDVRGTVDIQVFYKPDQYPGWIPWHTWSISVDASDPNARPGYFPDMGLGRPKSTDDNTATSQSTRFGYTFQTRIVIRGHCRVLGMKYVASLQPEPKIKTPIDGAKNIAISSPSIDDYQIYDLTAGIENPL